jgi:PST family polysaccharide transporter
MLSPTPTRVQSMPPRRVRARVPVQMRDRARSANGIADPRRDRQRHSSMSLRARMVTGVAWTGAARWIGAASSVVSMAVLARLLVPEDFAVVAAAGAVTGLLGIVQDSGLGAALVHQAGDDRRAATTALTFHLVLATIGVGICLALTPWLAAFFHIQHPAALAVGFAPLWLRAWTIVPTARLQKALAFRRCAAVRTAPSLVYPLVSVPLAVAGLGPWALVLGQAAAGTAAAAAAWALARWRPRLREFDWATGRKLAAYGRPILGASLLGTVNDRIDRLVAGRVLGPAALGLYATAFGVATLPRTGVTFAVSEVLFPALSGLRDDEPRFRALFLRSLHWVGTFTIPAAVGLALLAPELVHTVLGPRWAPAVTPVRVLAGFAALASLSGTTGDVFKASGRPELVFRIGLVHSLVLWPGLALLAPYGLPWVALAVTLATAVSAITAFACALSILRLRATAVLRALGAPIVASAAMAVAILAARSLLSLPVSPVALVVLAALGGAAYALVLALLAFEDVTELAAMLLGTESALARRALARAANRSS